MALVNQPGVNSKNANENFQQRHTTRAVTAADLQRYSARHHASDDHDSQERNDVRFRRNQQLVPRPRIERQQPKRMMHQQVRRERRAQRRRDRDRDSSWN
jgi:hypothetical protein